MEYQSFLQSAAHVIPNARQLAWYEMQFYAFVHFTVNTYTDLEWGLGNEDETIFNPYDLDCDEWVAAVKSAGMKGIILTAKHHDGFCLWQTETTAHSVKKSPWKNGRGDVVRECAEACRRGGIKFGVYLSPWDRNASVYGTDAYNDFYCAQLTELLTNYGDIFMVWFDGACGEGPNGKKQVYDFPRYIETVRRLQPGAFMFSDYGPDVRWCGNEAGTSRRAEWAVIPHEMCYRAEKQGSDGPMAGDLSFMYNSDECCGDTSIIQYAHGFAFCGAEIDMSIRPGWFYHKNEQPHSVERLMKTYLNSCGNNTSFNLNIPPMPSGRFDSADIARLREFGEALNDAFGAHKQIPYTMEELPVAGTTQRRIRLSFSEPVSLAYIELAENIAAGQRVELFRILKNGRADTAWNRYCTDIIYNGYTVGNRKICPVGNVTTDAVEIQILSARDTVELKPIIVYKK
ncbi:MAG: alpha-L-fucosidase [Clostridia bacterium]|nr:alpha-L-fucosidase [Clostridia bacterium]